MPDIFDEVDSDLRSERMRAELVRYGKFLGVAAVILIIGIVIWQGMLWRERQSAQHAGAAYFAAIEALATPPATTTGGGATGSAQAEEALARLSGANTPVGYRTLARLQAAALAAKGGNTKLALKLWQEIVSDKGASPLYQGLARLLWVTHQIASVQSGSDVSALTAELAPLLIPDNPWRPMAEEARALIALGQHDDKTARSALRAIAEDPAAPPDLHARAAALLARLSS